MRSQNNKYSNNKLAVLLTRYENEKDETSRREIARKIKKIVLDPEDQISSGAVCAAAKIIYSESRDSLDEWISIELLHRAATAGNREAKKLLKQCIKNFKKYATNGDVISQSMLGRYLVAYYEDSYNESKNMWLQKAAGQDDAEAMAALSYGYFYGKWRLEKNYQNAFKYAKRSFEKGNLIVAYNLGFFYANGIGCQMNEEEARKCYEIAIKDNHPKASEALEKLIKKCGSKVSDDMVLDLDKPVSQKDLINWGNFIIKSVNDNTKKQSELTRITVISESKKIRKLVKAIPEETKKLIFSKLDEVTRANTEFIKYFEEMHKQLEKGISDIQWTVNETQYNIETLSSKMQEFFDKMEEECKKQADSPQCSSLRDACETELSSLFGIYWTNGQLLESTKESLIAARVLLACAEREGLYDCRGIVISATSALERELKARFYTGVREYLIEQNVWDGETEEDLPKNLQKKINTNEDKFTLGDVMFILKCEHYATKVPQNNYSENQITCLRNYLRYNVLSDDVVSNKYKQGGRYYVNERPEDIFVFNGRPSFTEKLIDITNDYRNPAAHTSETSKTKAQQCCIDVIGQGKTEITKNEGLLFELFKLTEKFKHKN